MNFRRCSAAYDDSSWHPEKGFANCKSPDFLSELPDSVRELWLDVSPNLIPSLKRFHQLERIRYSPPDANWLGAASLFAELPAIEKLNVSIIHLENLPGVAETDEAISKLKSATTLRELSVPAPGVTKAGLVPLLAACPLESLSIQGPVFFDQELAEAVSRSRALRDFEVWNAFFLGTATLQSMLQGNQMKKLALNWLATIRESSSLQGSWFEAFVKDPREALFRCELQDRGASDEALGAFNVSSNLESLTMDRCDRITDAGIASITRLRRLKDLSIEDTRITNNGSQALGVLTELESLSISFSPSLTGDAGAGAWRNLTKLRHLQPSYCAGLTDDFIEAITPLNELKTILLNGCAGITDAGVAKLARFPNLERTSLSLCRSNDHPGNPCPETVLAVLNACPKLLWMDNTPDTWSGEDAAQVSAILNQRIAARRKPRTE
ncbi:hypothetical protein PLCT2_01312 [Planctomycetaceae bacterium]|nr:hypothetical protein PLCT2_01312 [Planctomycetaceae bacterium]